MNPRLVPLLLLSALSRLSVANALLFNDPPRRRNQRNSKQADNNVVEDRMFGTSTRYSATQQDIETTWSKPGTRNESRLGVRRRVRAVLAKARERTGVLNDSESGVAAGLFPNSDDMMFDSNLSMEATLGDWSFSANNMEDTSDGSGSDALRSDPTLSMAMASSNGERSSSSSTIESTLLKYASEPENDNSHRVVNGKSAPPATFQAASMESGSSSSRSAEESSLSQKEGIAQKAAQQPLPFGLPPLSPKQRQLLGAGERVQEQSKMGGEGSGFVVMDIKAPDYAIWEVLLDFERYPENIGTVRSMTMFTNTHLGQSFYAEKPLPPGAVVRHYGKASISRAKFVLSKFRLNIAAVHRYQPHPEGHYMTFSLDKACKNVVLRDAKGIWYLEANPDGKEGYTRVWLLCELKVSPLLPIFIVDYAAQRAMPRATNWLAPAVETYLKQEQQQQQ